METIVDAKIMPDPFLSKLYRRLVKELRGVGKITLEEKATSVHVRAKTTFAGIHARKDHLILQIVSEAPLASDRVSKVERISKNRIHNHIKISSEADFDPELRRWLAQSYELMS